MDQFLQTMARVDSAGGVSRRSFLRTLSVGTAAGLCWNDRLGLAAESLRAQGKSMIVLWMQGGPSQFETFDPKPHSQSPAIQTAVPGIEIAGHFPKTAKLMRDLCIVRSMTNKEGNHTRASYQLHTGNLPSGAIKHPSLGSMVCQEIAPAEFELPSFVSILGPSQGAGFLPVTYAPFQIPNPRSMPENSQLQVSPARYERRLRLLSTLERGYRDGGAGRIVDDHQNLVGQSSRLVRSRDLEAFDISKESAKVRAEYGDSDFGQGCLLARRLVETGVTYVEVQLGNWDTHFDNERRVADLSGQCDPAMAALVTDLKRRGLLSRTLVVWMGEFGRTPKINGRAGRDHFPRAFSMVMAGCGIPGGTVIGATDSSGSAVADRPVTVPDLLTTFCSKLGIDANKENIGPLNRPLKIVDGGAPIV